MPYPMTIAVLANSRKPGGSCVAGLDKASGFTRWVRPVSTREGEAINASEQQCSGGGIPELLDLVEIRFARPGPHQHQQENHVIDSTAAWRKVGALSWNEARAAVQPVHGPLWENGHQSRNRRNNRVPGSRVSEFHHSLLLIEPNDLRIFVDEEDTYSGPRVRVRAAFNAAGYSYVLEVTDPVAEDDYRGRGIGMYAPPAALLCVSLGEVFEDGNAYNLVAGVIER